MIRCHGCGYSEEIVSFTHGFDNPCPITKGYQCQSCGEFQILNFLGDKRVSSDKCSCGGKLSNENPFVFVQNVKQEMFHIFVHM